MDILFEQIKNKDKQVVLSLFKNAAEKISKMKVDHWQYWKNPPIEKIKWVEEGILNNEFFFIKTSDKKTMGMVRILNEDLLYWGQQPEKAKYIHSLVIEDAYNGLGLGAKVIEKIENEARKINYKYLRLDSDAKNTRLCGYYEKLGFEKVGTKELPLSVNNLYEKKLR